MTALSGAKILILATDGFEQAELMKPLFGLRDAGATVDVTAPPDTREEFLVRGWDRQDWGDSVPVDKKLADARVENYDALVLPGGQMNPDKLRVNEAAMALVKSFLAADKTVAAICHAPWLLVEAGAVKGRRATSWPSIKTDLVNAGANWEDTEVVVDGAMITSRKPADLDAFIAAIVEQVGARRSKTD